MDRLGSQVGRELSRFGPADSDMGAIVRVWPGVVGEEVAKNAWPARLARDGTLNVNASSSTWAFELGRMAADILERLRAELGDATPPGLRFVPGPIPDAASAPAEERWPTRPEVAPEDAAQGAEIAASIEDESLRAIVARAAAASLAKARRNPPPDRRF